MSINRLSLITLVAWALSFVPANADYFDQFNKKIHVTTGMTNSEYERATPRIESKDSSNKLDGADWVTWKKKVESRLNSDSYKKYREQLLSDYDTECEIDFTIDRNGKISDIVIATKSSKSMFNTIAENAIDNLDEFNLLSFPADSKIDKLRLTGKLTLPRKLLHPWAINEF